MFGRFTIAARNLGRPVFVGKKCLNEKKMTCFLEKIVLVCRFKQQFFHKSPALGHERVQFILAGLSSGFAIATSFSRADPGAKRRKKNLLQKQLPSSKPKPFPQESNRLLNPY